MKNKKKESLLCEEFKFQTTWNTGCGGEFTIDEFKESKKKKAPVCATCGSKEVSVIGYCYECGDTSIDPSEDD